MLASGRYPWTVIPVEKRDDYLAALGKASVKQEIDDFAKLIGGLVSESLMKYYFTPLQKTEQQNHKNR